MDVISALDTSFYTRSGAAKKQIVIFVGARPHHFIAKMKYLILLKCTNKKQSDGARCTT